MSSAREPKAPPAAGAASVEELEAQLKIAKDIATRYADMKEITDAMPVSERDISVKRKAKIVKELFEIARSKDAGDGTDPRVALPLHIKVWEWIRKPVVRDLLVVEELEEMKRLKGRTATKLKEAQEQAEADVARLEHDLEGLLKEN